MVSLIQELYGFRFKFFKFFLLKIIDFLIVFMLKTHKKYFIFGIERERERLIYKHPPIYA
jgi:hypothetical protein